MPHGFPPAAHSGFATDGTGEARLSYAPLPTGGRPARCHGRSNAVPGRAQFPGSAAFVDKARIIGSVTLNSVWSSARPASLATHRRNSCHQRQQLGHVMAIGLGQKGGQGEPIGVSNQVVLTSRFASVRGMGSRFSPIANRSDRPAIHQGTGPINLVIRSQFDSRSS